MHGFIKMKAPEGFVSMFFHGREISADPKDGTIYVLPTEIDDVLSHGFTRFEGEDDAANANPVPKAPTAPAGAALPVPPESITREQVAALHRTDLFRFLKENGVFGTSPALKNAELVAKALEVFDRRDAIAAVEDAAVEAAVEDEVEAEFQFADEE